MREVTRERKLARGRRAYPDVPRIISSAKLMVAKEKDPIELEPDDFPKEAQNDPDAMNRFLTSLGNAIRAEEGLKLRMPQANEDDPVAVKVRRKTYQKGQKPKTETVSVAVEIHAD